MTFSDIPPRTLNQATTAKAANRALATAVGVTRNRVLTLAAQELRLHRDEVLTANALDMQQGHQDGLSKALLDRLLLDEKRVEAMALGLEEVAQLADPLGREEGWRRPSGLSIRKVAVPLGLLGIIYEARPNVTIEAASLAIKSGNCCLLRGSRSAAHSNVALVKLVQSALQQAGLPQDCVQGLEDTGRESIDHLCAMRGLIDCLIPRGGADLISRVVMQSKVPVLETGVGNCHLYVHSGADVAMAVPLILNSKCSRPAVCNALETLLIDAAIADKLLAELLPHLQTNQVEVRGCPQIVAKVPGAKLATEEDWQVEFLDLILAVRIVDNLDQALEHIARYGSQHTEAIVTGDLAAARRFQSEVDACAVNVNASTRFTDGGQFGFGAEIGISTQKFHARGPVGLQQLTAWKYLVEGNGHVRR